VSARGEPNAITPRGDLDPELWDALDRLAMAHEGDKRQTVTEAALVVYERWRKLHIGPPLFPKQAISLAEVDAAPAALQSATIPTLTERAPEILAPQDERTRRLLQFRGSFSFDDLFSHDVVKK